MHIIKLCRWMRTPSELCPGKRVEEGTVVSGGGGRERGAVKGKREKETKVGIF